MRISPEGTGSAQGQIDRQDATVANLRAWVNSLLKPEETGKATGGFPNFNRLTAGWIPRFRDRQEATDFNQALGNFSNASPPTKGDAMSILNMQRRARSKQGGA
jgi:hypothetical protein